MVEAYAPYISETRRFQKNVGVIFYAEFNLITDAYFYHLGVNGQILNSRKL